MELEHLHRIAEIEVEDLVRREHVHLREATGLEQVVDGRSCCAAALRRVYLKRRRISAAEVAALNNVGDELKVPFDLFGGHCFDGIAAELKPGATRGSGRAPYCGGGCRPGGTADGPKQPHTMEPAMKVQVYTASWCRDCRAAKQFLDSHGIVYTEINVDTDPAASAEVLRHVGKRAIPQLVIDGEWFQPYRPGRGLLYEELYQRLRIARS